MCPVELRTLICLLHPILHSTVLFLRKTVLAVDHDDSVGRAQLLLYLAIDRDADGHGELILCGRVALLRIVSCC